MFEKEKYEKPTVEVVEFELSDSIAVSGPDAIGSFGFEEIWGGK